MFHVKHSTPSNLSGFRAMEPWKRNDHRKFILRYLRPIRRKETVLPKSFEAGIFGENFIDEDGEPPGSSTLVVRSGLRGGGTSDRGG